MHALIVQECIFGLDMPIGIQYAYMQGIVIRDSYIGNPSMHDKATLSPDMYNSANTHTHWDCVHRGIFVHNSSSFTAILSKGDKGKIQ